jgi:hypothetical protein
VSIVQGNEFSKIKLLWLRMDMLNQVGNPARALQKWSATHTHRTMLSRTELTVRMLSMPLLLILFF